MKRGFLSNSLVVLLLVTYGIIGITFYFYSHSARAWDISESIFDYEKKTQQNRADWTVRFTWVQQNLTWVQIIRYYEIPSVRRQFSYCCLLLVLCSSRIGDELRFGFVTLRFAFRFELTFLLLSVVGIVLLSIWRRTQNSHATRKLGRELPK